VGKTNSFTNLNIFQSAGSGTSEQWTRGIYGVGEAKNIFM